MLCDDDDDDDDEINSHALINHRIVSIGGVDMVCRHNTRSSHLKVVLGDHDRSVFENTQISVQVEEVFVHPGYIGIRNYWRDDVAVLKLDRDVIFTKYIRPICLPWHSCEEDIANCYVTGWGKSASRLRNIFLN